MSGIERLRTIAGAWDEWGLGGSLTEIADKIERDFADARMGHDSLMRILEVASDMERHCLGHEGMEDSPVARWARELRDALGALHAPGFQESRKVASSLTSHSDASDVSMSAYDLLPTDERESIAWVRDHGGLDHVKSEWRSRVPHDLYERSRQRLLDHIAECETALGRRRRRIEELGKTIEFFQLNNSNFRHLLADVAERLGFTRYGDDYEPEDLLDALDRRLMPEGCEWPRYESEDLVMFGDCVENRNGTCTVKSVRFYSGGGVSVYGEERGAQFVVVTEPVMRDPIRKARPKVFAADGEPLEVGQMVWDVRGIRQFRVLSITSDGEHGEYTVETVGVDRMGLSGWSKPSDLTHQRPVLDADGVPIREGDEVRAIWNLTGHSYVVEDASNPLEIAVRAKEYPDQRTTLRAKNLTHAKPAIDSWERIEEDADALVDAEINGEGSYNAANAYCNRRGLGEGTSFVLMAQDLVRRCRALAEKENRNE